MATKNTFFTLRKVRSSSNAFLKLTILASMIAGIGCAQFSRRGEPETSGGGSQQEGGFETHPDVKVPMKEAEVPPKVAVILGPGGYRTFGHATVLKEFVRARIPIEKVIGLEWGALAGAFYAMDGKAHEGEWKLYKLEKKDLEAQGFFARKNEPQAMKSLQKYLSENFGNRDLSSLKVKFSCPSLSLQTGAVTFFERGSVAAAMEMCLSYPPQWTPSRNAVAAALSVNEAVDRLRREGYNVIILVNVLGNGPLPLGREDFGGQVLWNEVRRSLWIAKSRVTDVVEVDMKGMALYDLESRKASTQAAEKAAQSAVKVLADKYGF